MSADSSSIKTFVHYEIDGLLGAGGMAKVYRGRDLRLGRQVALKFLHPFSDSQAQRQFIEEARAASSLDHPNICTIFEIEETTEGEVFIVMAYYEGESLDRILARGPLEVGRALSIAIQTGRGLAAAHQELIVHQDIKPGNLMITPGDTVKILDFGQAKVLGESPPGKEGVVIGTPQYMSPEQLCGEAVDQRTDIWSLGAVFFEMLTGRLPFQGEDLPTTIQSILHHRPPRVSALREGMSSRLDQIVETALSKRAEHRYDHIDVMVRELMLAQAALDSGAITLRLPAAKRRRSIAVLPFEDMSPNRDQGYLCDGIAEEILRALSRIPDLYVASRTSSFQFKNQTADIREIGARLNVEAVLEGSVRRVGDRLRIATQLVNVENGYRLWYERYDHEMKDLFSIEDEIAERIAQALQVTLVEKPNLPSEDNTDAYELYLQGRQYFHQHRRKAFEIAIQTFSQAIELAPNYARAYAGIADCHSFLHLYFGHGMESVEAADEASARALMLNPELPEAHASRGLVNFLRRRFGEAEAELQRAIELDPRLYDPHYIFGRVCFSQGRIEEAASHFRHACEIVPEAYDSWYLLGMCYRRLGETARARNADLDCIEAVKKWVRYHQEDTRALTMGAAVMAKLGEPERAAVWIERALKIDADEPIIEYNAACVYVALGKHDEALRCLEASLASSGISRDWVVNDPDLDPLRSDPRFATLLMRLK